MLNIVDVSDCEGFDLYMWCFGAECANEGCHTCGGEDVNLFEEFEDWLSSLWGEGGIVGMHICG